MPNEPTINPYNFVPIPQTGPDRAAFSGWLQVTPQSYSGRLSCELEALSPLFSAAHQKAIPESPKGQRRWFPFLRNSQNKEILQGTTVKGMVRAVYEALSHSCLPLAATSGSSKKAGADVEYSMMPLSAYAHSGCDSRDTLCPACRLFGVIQGDEVQGRVIFTDAVLCQGELTQKQIQLQELSSPKPHHYQIYSKTRKEGGSIAGRKFFYHYAATATLGVDSDWSRRANGITEVAPVGTRFAFDVQFGGLTEKELAHLVHALVLDDGLGHKVGMGKPIGFGSCRIHISPSTSVVHQGAIRYQIWNASPIVLDIVALKAKAAPFSAELQEVLRLDKHGDGTIGYLSFHAYKDNAGIDPHGKYQTGKVSAKKTGSASGATIAEQTLSKKKAQAKPDSNASTGKLFKKGDKIRVEVVAREGNRYTLRVPETSQQEIFHEAIHLPWQVGDHQSVTIVSVGPDGQIKKVRL